MNTISFRPVNKTNWKDLENLFESKGAPHNCWCMVWRNMEDGKNRSNKKDKKSSLKSYIESELPVGILCYENDSPIAWCSIAPRESYRELGGVKSITNVWSLVCFFIKREYRGKGLINKLIRQAELHSKKNGAKYLEVYPVAKDSPSYRFMGFKDIFEELGYEFKQKASSRRNVMIKAIS